MLEAFGTFRIYQQLHGYPLTAGLSLLVILVFPKRHGSHFLSLTDASMQLSLTMMGEDICLLECMK